MNRSLASEAVVLSSKAFGEADKLITVFSRDFGKITLVAKGVKRLTSRKRGSLEVFSIVKVFAHRGRGMPILTEVEIVDNLVEFRNDLTKVSVAYFFSEVVSRTTRDEEVHPEVYELLRRYLEKLKDESALSALRKSFSLELMETQGFIPKGQFVPDADSLLESIIERKLGSVRVGKKLLR